MADGKTPRYRTYKAPAGGWGAAAATAKVLLEQSVVAKGSKALAVMNKPGGFKCPSCAYPDQACGRKFDFCENGAKALAHEATKFRVGREFFAQYSVADLMRQSDYWLEMQGRLTEPMRYDAATDHYVPCGWDEAFALIGEHLRKLDSPHQAEFYTSGRTANETAFLYSIFVREFGTNNFPDCSNMCHEPTSRGLPPAIGVGKGTVVIEDFEHAEAIFVIGQNTGTNAPRMMTNLVEARKRGIPIVAVNPMPERALIRFAEPQDVVQMATFGSTPISSEFVHIRIGGDLAFLKGIMKPYHDVCRLLNRNKIFIDRLRGIGVLTKEEAISRSATGPIARASGVLRDLRKDEPYLAYKDFDFNVIAANFGQTGRTFSQGNFNYDPAGNVNLDDFNLLASRFGTILPSQPDSQSPSVQGSTDEEDGLSEMLA